MTICPRQMLSIGVRLKSGPATFHLLITFSPCVTHFFMITVAQFLASAWLTFSLTFTSATTNLDRLLHHAHVVNTKPGHNKAPFALSAGIFERGMYHYVLCHFQKFPLSRIWNLLAPRERVGGKKTEKCQPPAGRPAPPHLFCRTHAVLSKILHPCRVPPNGRPATRPPSGLYSFVRQSPDS